MLGPYVWSFLLYLQMTRLNLNQKFRAIPNQLECCRSSYLVENWQCPCHCLCLELIIMKKTIFPSVVLLNVRRSLVWIWKTLFGKIVLKSEKLVTWFQSSAYRQVRFSHLQRVNTLLNMGACTGQTNGPTTVQYGCSWSGGSPPSSKGFFHLVASFCLLGPRNLLHSVSGRKMEHCRYEGCRAWKRHASLLPTFCCPEVNPVSTQKPKGDWKIADSRVPRKKRKQGWWSGRSLPQGITKHKVPFDSLPFLHPGHMLFRITIHVMQVLLLNNSNSW